MLCLGRSPPTQYYNTMSAPRRPGPSERPKPATKRGTKTPTIQVQEKPLSPDDSHHMQIQAFTKKFNRIYEQYYIRRGAEVDELLLDEICNTLITMDLFNKLTLGKQYQGRIALVDGMVRFDQIPLSPHGQIISWLTSCIDRALGVTLPGAMLQGCSDNGMHAQFDYDANREDIVLTAIRKKRPDHSWGLRRTLLPNPPPAWIQFDARGVPTANIVVEVAVENENPDQLMSDCCAYFGPNTSTTLWIGVKVGLAGQNLWVGWAERAPNGIGPIVHTQMQWVQNHTSYLVPTNIIYNIPMQIAFGPGIPIPVGTPPTIDIDVEMIRLKIVENV
jgi:hypothetical protein